MDPALFEAPAEGGPGAPHPRPAPDQGAPPPAAREPLLNAPWAVVLLVTVIVAGYFAQTLLPPGLAERVFALTPEQLAAGQWSRLFSSQFVHGGWAHALMNGAFVLAFGAPVARFFGPRPSGVILFLTFYLLCGALAGLGFLLLHLGQPVALVGASGAASGLMGAAARLIGGQGRVGPVFSSAVLSLGASWVLVNIFMALFGGFIFGAAVGWEAHLAGFAAGVLLIGPFGWAVRAR